MSHPHYPSGTVLRLLNSEHVTPATRERIRDRMQAPSAPHFFSPGEYALLEAVCARLIPQPDRAHPVPIAPFVDFRLSKNMANGWRYDSMPPDGEAFKLGLAGVDDVALHLWAKGFLDCLPGQQDAVLLRVQNGDVTGAIWKRVPPQRFFEELLGEVAEIYYAHPQAQDEIGYVGFADVPGWQRIGLNEHEPREPKADN